MVRHIRLKFPIVQGVPMEKLIFIHIPKCAGTTMSRFLDDRYAARDIYPPHNPNEEGFQKTGPQEYKLVRGHFNFSELKKRGLEGKYITVLREPKSRLISEYHQIRRTTEADMNKHSALRVQYEEVTRMTLADFVRTRGNAQTIALSTNPPCLKTAINNLESMSLVGCTDQLELFSSQLCQLMNWPRTELDLRLNPTSDDEKEKSDWDSDELKRALIHSNELDTQLYKHAKDLIATQTQGLPPLDTGKASVDVGDQYYFCERFEGTGWHRRECFNPNDCFRWTSSETAIVNIHPEIDLISEVKLNVLACKFDNPKNSIRILVNKTPCKVKVAEGPGGGMKIEAHCVKPQKGNTNVEIKIQTPKPQKIRPELGDNRLGGIAVSSIKVYKSKSNASWSRLVTRFMGQRSGASR